MLLDIICIGILLFIALIYFYLLSYMITAGAAAGLKRYIIEIINSKNKKKNGKENVEDS